VNPALRSSAAHVVVSSLDAPELEADDAHHLQRVLRLRDGETVSITDGIGGWRRTTFTGGQLHPSGEVHHEGDAPDTVVVSAIPKGDRAEWMVQKLTELGIGRIVLLHSARSVVRWEGERGRSQLARMQRIAREAAMQSRRVHLPVVDGPVSFAEAATYPGAVLAEPDGERLGSLAAMPRCVIVGPEGGFSPEELAVGLPRLCVASTVLRVETAAVALASLQAAGGAT
jgi:16S rRNA (uracil1498-N3)-methyltransferase